MSLPARLRPGVAVHSSPEMHTDEEWAAIRGARSVVVNDGYAKSWTNAYDLETEMSRSISAQMAKAIYDFFHERRE